MYRYRVKRVINIFLQGCFDRDAQFKEVFHFLNDTTEHLIKSLNRTPNNTEYTQLNRKHKLTPRHRI